MNLRCIYCQTPFTISRNEMLGAIVTMNEKSQNHYDAHCPRCRRANSISRQRMELFFPNWREAAKQMAAAPASPPVSASVTAKTEPLPKAVKKAAAKTTTAKKPAAAKKTTASKKTTAKSSSKTTKTSAKTKKK
jgi:hypothetical protein